MFRSIFLAVVLFLLWLVLSGIYTPILISFGVLSAIIVAWIAYRMDVADHEGFPIQLSWKAVSYWPWLIVEIIKSNIAVAGLILGSRENIKPILIRIPANQKTELGQVTYANSITLTPGTVSIAVGENMIDVHSLSKAAAQDLQQGVMHDKVCRLEDLNYSLPKTK